MPSDWGTTMITVPGYTRLEEIYQGVKTVIYRGHRQSSTAGEPQSVILKILKTEYPTPIEIAQFQHEYQVAKRFVSSRIVKPYGIETHNNTFILVMEDFGGESLSQFIQRQKIELLDFLKIAIQIVDGLIEIHQHNILHKDIKPQNIIINPKIGEVKITDFGISSWLSRETPAIKNPNSLEGTLAYISPEQTGRMNRSVDYRTDFYSLGITFYELLTSNLPFQASDPMEMVHCHIARKETPLCEVNPQIPSMLSAIVSKLLSKMAEDRYQSAYGLKHDLEICLKQWERCSTIEAFAIAQQDIPDRFQIPQKLYGREQELITLMNAFEQVSQGTTEMVLVSGFSGIGKSALVHEIHKPIVQKRGYFVSGKFDQLQRNIPYDSLIQAFQELVRQLLTESAEHIQNWRTNLLNALGVNAQVIIDVIPEVEYVIGTQPPVPQLLAQEAQNRFNRVFQQFISVFAQKEHPLVLFLDDLQWADTASLKLIQHLVTETSDKALLMIGAYRDNEVTSTHPLMLTLNEIQSADVKYSKIILKPLSLNHVSNLLADTLYCSVNNVKTLAEVVLHKTNGNPFFLGQFLKTLYTSDLLHFDFKQGVWIWDLAGIKAREITDNVVEFMADKIQKLPADTQTMLQLAACIGNNFDLKTLSIVAEVNPLAGSNTLWSALEEGLILPADSAYKTAQDYNSEMSELSPIDDLIQELLGESTIAYSFLHDRVQQAAYSLMSGEEQQAIHLKMGRLLLQNTTEDEMDLRIFDIVNHFNRGIELITDEIEKQKLIQLNLMAGQKAKASAAYEPALKYFKMGMQLLDGESWRVLYNLTLSLYSERSECEYLIGNFEQAEHFFDVILNHVKTKEEKASLYVLKVILYTNVGRLHEAIAIGVDGLILMGINLTEKSIDETIQQDVAEIQTALSNKTIQDLYQLPVMTDPKWIAVMNILISLAAPTYFTNIKVWMLIVVKMVNCSLKYGNSYFSSFAYAAYGLLTGSAFGDYQTGYELGQLSLSVNEKFNNIAFNSKIYFMLGAFINHWRRHVKEDFEYLKKAFTYGNETGDPSFSCYAANILASEMFIKGDSLESVYRESRTFGEYVTQIKDILSIYFHEILQQMVLSLQGLTDSPTSFNTAQFDEEKTLQEMQVNRLGIPLHFYYITKLQSFYLFGDYDAAVQIAKESETMIQTSFGLLRVAEHYFYYSLTLTALYPTASAKEKEAYWVALTEYRSKFKHWSENCPENFQHKFLLIAAEMARLLEQDLEAIDLYDRSIASAQEYEFTQNEAIANELAAKFYLQKGKSKIAKAYMMDARYGYVRWGATAKVNDLDKCYSHLLSRTTLNLRSGFEDIRTSHSTTNGSSLVLDLSSVLKASQTLSKEILLGKLLQKMMKILIENAGAERGVLILEQYGQLFIEAQGSTQQSEVIVLQSVPIGISTELPLTLINYVARTMESIVLDDASNEGRFTSDPYILSHQPTSILCTPILSQGKLIGILYLENNLIAGAFTADRLEVLQLLSSQSAISIENARLYHNLEQALATQIQLTQAYGRFVPHEFLQLLGKESIVDVQLGNQVQLEMSVMFSDICDFTALSEQMTPEENFKFINSYLSRMESVITENNGFIDKYIGDSIMALFSGAADDAVSAAIAMISKLVEYNQLRAHAGYQPIQIGIGINTGSLMLGTVGGSNRMDSTVISDAVNLASRIEKLTRDYGVTLLISHQTFSRLQHPERYAIRKIDQVKVKGKLNLVTVYEVFDADPPTLRDGKLATEATFMQALAAYNAQQYQTATELFKACLQHNPQDSVARIYLGRCFKFNSDV
jgi:predicted ATPase/class 3 adenylate cyclase